MKDTHYRKATRSKVWPDTEATATVRVSSKPPLMVKGPVGDLGAKGLFLFTHDFVPVNARAEVEIDFDANSEVTRLKLTALGKTVHRTDEGVGIQFTTINLVKLQDCIISKINRMGNFIK